MKRALSHHFLTALALCAQASLSAYGQGAAPAQKTTPPPQERFALLVGINKYPYVDSHTDKKYHLQGCVQDVKDMHGVLTGAFSFPDDATHIMELLDEKATRDNILKAFSTQLIENAKKHPHAIVVFMFSGHGSIADDITHGFASGKTATMVPEDRDNPEGRPVDIKGYEIGRLLNDLSRYTENATFLLDSCHSEAATRGDPMFTVRELPQERAIGSAATVPVTRPEPPAEGQPASETATIGLTPPNPRYVTIAACFRYEEAGEWPRDAHATKHNGLMTSCLIEALRRADKTTSYRQLVQWMSPAVTEKNAGQHPQAEGDLNRFVFGGAADRDDPFIPVTAVNGQTVTIKAGKAQGIAPGSLVSIYPAAAHKLDGTMRPLLEKLPVQAVTAFTSTIEAPSGVTVDTSTKAVLAAPAFSDRPLRVAVKLDNAGSEEDALSTKLADQLKDDKIVQVVKLPGAGAERDSAAAGCDVFVTQGIFGKTFEKGEYTAPSSTDAPLPAYGSTVYYVRAAGPDASPLMGLFVKPDDPQLDEKIAAVLGKRSKQNHLLALQNDESGLGAPLTLSVIPIEGHKDPNGLFVVEKQGQAMAPSLSYPFALGQHFRLRIKRTNNQSQKRLFATLLDIAPDGSVSIMYPREGASGELRPNESVETLVYVTSPPLGQDTFKLIVTTEREDFTLLEQGAVARGVSKDIKTVSPLQRLMMEAAGEIDGDARKRAEPVVTADPQDWVTTQISLIVSDLTPAPVKK